MSSNLLDDKTKEKLFLVFIFWLLALSFIFKIPKMVETWKYLRFFGQIVDFLKSSVTFAPVFTVHAMFEHDGCDSPYFDAIRACKVICLVYITWMMVGRESSIPKSKVELKSNVDVIVFSWRKESALDHLPQCKTPSVG